MNARGSTLLRRLLLALLLGVAALALLGLLAAALLHGPHGEGLNLRIAGERWSPDGGVVHGTMSLVWLVGLLVVVLIGVPLVVLGALLSAVLSVVLSVGGLLLALALVLGIALSPLIVLVALLWWLLRPRRPPSPTMRA